MDSIQKLGQTGDIGIVFGTGFISKLISKATFGEATHVFLLCDNFIYETESPFAGGAGQSRFVPLDKYDEGKYKIFRYREIKGWQRDLIAKLCDIRRGTRYSLWDCVVNGAFFFLHPQLRGKIATKLGTKYFTKCDEEALTILYKALGYEPFKDYESFTPQDLYLFLRGNPDFDLILTNIS